MPEVSLSDFSGWKMYRPAGGQWTNIIDQIERNKVWALIYTAFDEEWDVWVAGSHWGSNKTEAAARAAMQGVLDRLKSGPMTL
jgi:hypothetical protein